MPEAYSSEIYHAVSALFLSGIVAFAYKTARDATLQHGRWWTAWRSVAWCLGLALFAAAILGKPTCEQDDGDPIRGGCEVYADDGFDPTLEERIARFLFVAMLLTFPALAGVFNTSHWEIVKRETDRAADL